MTPGSYWRRIAPKPDCRWLCEQCWIELLEKKGIEAPPASGKDLAAKKSLQQRLQEHKRRLGEACFQRKARALPPLDRLPIGHGHPTTAAPPPCL
eukprot:7836090-Pyramimonas_sp.AAC.1